LALVDLVKHILGQEKNVTKLPFDSKEFTDTLNTLVWCLEVMTRSTMAMVAEE